MPSHQRQVRRQAKELEVPQPGADAEERKRVLNVLAQRRYRQRRREQLQRLQAQAFNTAGGVNDLKTPDSSTAVQSRHNNVKPVQPPVEPSSPPLAQVSSARSVNDGIVGGADGGDQPILSEHHHFPAFSEDMFDLSSEPQCFWDASLPSFPSGCPSTPLFSANSRPPSAESPSSSPSSSSLTSDSMGPGGLSETASSLRKKKAAIPLHRSAEYSSFPDEAYLEMPELKLFNGCISIARRLNVQDLIWSLGAQSPFFTDPAMTMMPLPSNLQPTLNQLSIPHHPIIDLLPWPSVRDRMIMVLSQPPEVRPPSAASPMALLDFVYDIEDGAEGVRIFGDDPYSEQNWEIGEKVFQSWWWMFDKDIVRRSNELRAFRGAPTLGSGRVLGEVV